MPEDADPLLLGQRVVAILETGQRDAAYKLATLMALIDHCIENLPANPEDVLCVPIPALAHWLNNHVTLSPASVPAAAGGSTPARRGCRRCRRR